jgi:hypothetical protein
MKSSKHRAPEPYKAHNPEILTSIFNQPQWLNLLFNKNKPYEKLLTHFLSLSKLMDEEKQTDTSIKGISFAVGEKTATVAKWIPLIYNDLYNLNAESPELFKAPGKRYDLYFHSTFYTSAYFTLWLDTPLHLYDRFSFGFIDAKIRSTSFWVERVSHSYVWGEHQINVTLNSGTHNKYRDYILDQAEFHRLIGLLERYSLPEYQMDERLREIFAIHHIR